MGVLKGNFETKKPVSGTRHELTVEEQFEKEALKRLGGSIAFVSKKKFLWTGDTEKAPGPAKPGNEE